MKLCYRYALFAAMLVALLGCANNIPVVNNVVGNNSCLPPSDLPSVLHMQKVPEAETGATQLYDLLLDERAAHAKDQESYNSLYKACVK